MSLSDMIQDRDYKELILKEFDKPTDFKNDIKMLYAPLAHIVRDDFVDVGYDYLVKIYLIWKYKHLNFDIDKELKHAIFMKTQNEIHKYGDETMINKVDDELSNVLSIINAVVKKQQWKVDESFWRAILFLTALDEAYKTQEFHRIRNWSWDHHLTHFINELAILAKSLDNLPIKVNKSFTFNLHFKHIPSMIQGVDSSFIEEDMMVDGALIDINTDLKAVFNDERWAQLVSYYLLCLDNAIPLKTVGIYFARFDYLYEIDLSKAIKCQQAKDFLLWLSQAGKTHV